ncbi:MAG: DUF402 domain-containing protein [Thermoplasmata archaeon]
MLVRVIRPHGETLDYEQELVEDRGNLIITRFTFFDFGEPLTIDRKVVVADGYEALMFEFFDPPLEILRITDMKGDFTGYYCNINTKPSRIEGGYEIVDLYIDVFVLPDMRFRILDEEEFEAAIREGWISKEQENLARDTVDRIVEDIAAGNFPPDIIRDFRG